MSREDNSEMLRREIHKAADEFASWPERTQRIYQDAFRSICPIRLEEAPDAR